MKYEVNHAHHVDHGENQKAPSDEVVYISPKELAERWRCTRTTAQRIAAKAGFRKMLLGEGRNGIVRYAFDDVLAYEQDRCTS